MNYQVLDLHLTQLRAQFHKTLYQTIDHYKTLFFVQLIEVSYNIKIE